MSPTLLQLAFVLSPTAVILLLVVLVYGWVAPPPVAPSEPFGSLVEVNGSFSYHEKNIDEEQEDQELGVWSLSLAKLYSPQVTLGEDVTTVRKQKLKESKSFSLLLTLFQFILFCVFSALDECIDSAHLFPGAVVWGPPYHRRPSLQQQNHDCKVSAYENL